MFFVFFRILLPSVLILSLTASCWSQKVVIDPDTPTGPIVRHFGWDAKLFANLCHSSKKAKWLYQDAPANLMRIPIRPQSTKPDGSPNFIGDVKAGGYGPLLKTIKAAKKVNPELKIFASTKLQGKDTFPRWLCSNRNGKIFSSNVKCPDPDKYSTLVLKYLEQMAAEGIKIDFLGLNNEVGGALTPELYVTTAKLLKNKLKKSSMPDAYKEFQWVGGEEFGVAGSSKFALKLKDSTKFNFMNVVGSHFYPDKKSGTIEQWQSLSSLGVPTWHSEVHVRDHDSSRENIRALRDGMCIVFKTNQAACQGYVWWAGNANRSVLTNLVRHQMIKTMLYGSCVKTSGEYLAKDNAPNQVVVQATRVGDTVWLWCFNPGGPIKQLPVELTGGTIESVKAAYWRGGKLVTPQSLGELKTNQRDRRIFVEQLPGESVVLVEIKLKDDRRLLPTQRWRRVKPKVDVFEAALLKVSGNTLNFKSPRGKKINVPIKSIGPEHHQEIQDALRAHGLK